MPDPRPDGVALVRVSGGVFDACRGEYGTKLTFLMRTLIDIRAKNPGQKSIIFSQWARLLKLTGDALKDNGFSFAYLAGKHR